jgi:hypothetical protein
VTSKSPKYTNTILLTNSATIHAKCFRGGKAVSGTATQAFKKADPQPAAQPGSVKPGLNYLYYEGNWDVVPDFSQLTAVSGGVIDNINILPRKSKEYYGLSFSGYIDIPGDDVYGFSTDSDDGSNLWIDGVKVVNNDGLHASQKTEGIVALKKGMHPIRIDYFNKTGGEGLTVFIRSVSMKSQEIPAAMLSH